ncbi:MAG: glycosyl hydrolase family 18 protein [Eubacteriales bacterium]|nr:glycosyl hydrolase family 18 protein [Eubacteriales bacterium]
MRRKTKKHTAPVPPIRKILCAVGCAALCLCLLAADRPVSAAGASTADTLTVRDWLTSGFGLFPQSLQAAAPTAAPEATPEAWRANIVPRTPGKETVNMVWQYRPSVLDAVPAGINVMAPTWYYVEADGEGKAVFHDMADMGYEKWDPSGYVETAHAAGAKVWATVVSFDSACTAQIVPEGAAQDAFLQRLAQEVEKYALDGINFDFEKMNPADTEAFTALVRRARETLPQNVTVSVCVTVPLTYEDPDNWYQSYDRAALAQVCDYICVMTYDSETDAVAPLSWVEQKLQLTLAAVPSDKLIMGVPFYGKDLVYTRSENSSPDEEFVTNGEKPKKTTFTPAMRDQLTAQDAYDVKEERVEVQSWREKGVWDEEWGLRKYVFLDTLDRWHEIWMEDSDSLKEKAKLAGEYQLAGTAVWQYSFGKDQDAMWQALAGE